jgi:hypothetical protein
MLRIATIAVHLIFAVIGAVANAETVPLGAGSLELLMPPGYCALSRLEAQDRLILERQDRIQDGDGNKVLLGIASCTELKDFRSGAANELAKTGLWLLNAPIPKQLLGSLTREQVIGKLAESLPRFDFSKMGGETRGRMKAEGIEIEEKYSGKMHQDKYGLYFGALMKYMSNGKSTNMAGVFGITIIKNQAITLNLYDIDGNPSSFDSLLEGVKSTIKNTVKINELDFSRFGVPLDEPRQDADPKRLFGEHDELVQKGAFDDLIPLSGSTQSFWERVLNRGAKGAISGAVLGGLFAIFAVVASLVSRRRTRLKGLVTSTPPQEGARQADHPSANAGGVVMAEQSPTPSIAPKVTAQNVSQPDKLDRLLVASPPSSKRPNLLSRISQFLRRNFVAAFAITATMLVLYAVLSSFRHTVLHLTGGMYVQIDNWTGEKRSCVAKPYGVDCSDWE